MKRDVLIIPRDEVEKHLMKNSRQDVKIVAPEILTSELFEILKSKGIEVKAERQLEGENWTHSNQDEPNILCESEDFQDITPPDGTKGAFSISFANEKAQQEPHYHRYHWEIYFSEHRLGAEYRRVYEAEPKIINLEEGGTIIFGPNPDLMIAR